MNWEAESLWASRQAAYPAEAKVAPFVSAGQAAG